MKLFEFNVNVAIEAESEDEAWERLAAVADFLDDAEDERLMNLRGFAAFDEVEESELHPV